MKSSFRLSAHLLFCMGLAATLLDVPLLGQGREYGRSVVATQAGVVATSQVLASQAGAQILARGGSAVDAAIAANAVLAVTEPMMSGMGGDLFALHWDSKTSKLQGINASGPAPRGLTPAFLAKAGVREMPKTGIHSVTVPGAVEGWSQLHARYGKLPWKDLFQYAIAYAEKGYPVGESIQYYWAEAEAISKLRQQPESAQTFLPEGKPPAIGALYRNPNLGKAFRMLAEKGPAAFYKGEIAAAVLSTSNQLGGTLTADDLASYSAEWVQPISTEYRGWRVYELPPNGQGMAALEMLNIMETASPAAQGFGSSSDMHRRIEAMKLAYSDLKRYNADPRFSDVPVASILDKEYARTRAKLIDNQKANCAVADGPRIGSDTTYLAVADKEGNVISLIQSISATFGSGITVSGMGFLLHNRGSLFTLEPDHPNVLAGGKRPFHTIIPAFMEKGAAHIAFGIMGGPNQPLAHAQFVSNIADYQMNIQAALEAPRFTKRNAEGCDIAIENRFSSAALQELSERGHEMRIRRNYTTEMGTGNAILHDSRTRINYAASDPRSDGAAIPEPLQP